MFYKMLDLSLIYIVKVVKFLLSAVYKELVEL